MNHRPVRSTSRSEVKVAAPVAGVAAVASPGERASRAAVGEPSARPPSQSRCGTRPAW